MQSPIAQTENTREGVAAPADLWRVDAVGKSGSWGMREKVREDTGLD